MPAYYERGENGVYAVENRQGGKEYRVYGRVNGQPAAWCAADENGNILDAQSAPVEPYDDFVAYVQGFKSEEPETVPAHYEKTESGVYTFENAEGEKEYRAYGSKDRGEANWYAVDEQGNLIAEDAQPVNPDEEEVAATEEPTAEPTEEAVPAMTLTTAAAQPTEAVVVMNAATEAPVAEPTDTVTEAPTTSAATEEPTDEPTETVTEAPATEEPTAEPTETATEAPTEAPVTEEPVTESPATEAPTAEPTAETKEESKSSSNWWIALVAAVIAVAGGGTAVATKKKNKK